MGNTPSRSSRSSYPSRELRSRELDSTFKHDESDANSEFELDEVPSGIGMLTMLVNFVLAEAKNVVLFLLGYRGVVQGVGYTIVTKKIEKYGLEDLSLGNMTVSSGLSLQPLSQHFDSLTGFSGCISSDIAGAMGTFSHHYQGHCIIIKPDNPIGNPLGYITVPIVVACSLLLLVQLTNLIKFYIECCSNGLHSTFNSGRYMQFVWKMYQSRPYKLVSGLLLAVAFVCVIIVLIIGVLYDNGFSFVLDEFMSLFGVVMGALGFTQSHVPAFAEDNESFGKLVFKRPWQNLLLQNCDGFASDLQHALYRASFGDISELEAIVDYNELGWKEFDAPAQKAVLKMILGKAHEGYACHDSLVSSS